MYRLHPIGGSVGNRAVEQIASLFLTASFLILSSAQAQMISITESMRGGGAQFRTQKTVFW